MLLKRVVDKTQDPIGTTKVTRADGTVEERPLWPLDHVKVLSAKDGQKFSPRFVLGAIGEGWLRMSGETLEFDTRPSVKYRIVAQPGRYCSFCDAKLPDDPEGIQARLHVAAEHPGKESPDLANPAGYRCDNFYACKLVGKPVKGSI